MNFQITLTPLAADREGRLACSRLYMTRGNQQNHQMDGHPISSFARSLGDLPKPMKAWKEAESDDEK